MKVAELVEADLQTKQPSSGVGASRPLTSFLLMSATAWRICCTRSLTKRFHSGVYAAWPIGIVNRKCPSVVASAA